MHGAALDEDVARLEERLAAFHHGVDLAFQHDDVIDRAGAMHHRIGGVLGLRMAGADGLEAVAAVRALRACGIGRELDDAHDAAVLRRLEMDRARRRVRGAFVGGGGGPRFPEVGERKARERRHLLHVRRQAVRGDDRLPVHVVPGDDAAHAPDHARASLGAMFLRAFTPASGASLKSQSSLRNGLGMPRRLASAASFTVLYLATSESFTANTASSSRYLSPSTNTCVITGA